MRIRLHIEAEAACSLASESPSNAAYCGEMAASTGKALTISAMVSIVLADRHTIVRQGIRQLLESEALFQVVGEAGTGAAAMQLAGRLAPQILLLDLCLPDTDGNRLIREMADTGMASRALVFSACGDEGRINEALKNGAWGYVPKTTGPAELLSAVRMVASRRHYLSPCIADALLARHFYRHGATHRAKQDSITSRERQVIGRSADGVGLEQIAKELGIRRSTAETHRSNAMTKLGLHSQTDVVRYALRTGLVNA